MNTGSVGRPKDGDWRAAYVLVDIDDGLPRAEIIRVEYDLTRAVRGIRESGLPDEFALMLERGGS